MNTCYVCLKWGTKYSAEYVNKLAAMIKRFDPRDIPIYCYTDDPTGIDCDIINLLPIGNQMDLETWWFKLPLLVHPELKKYDRKILFDLDVIIHNDLRRFDEIQNDGLTICHSYWKNPDVLLDTSEKNTLYNSSVMIWNNADDIYEHFNKDPQRYMVIYKGIDRFLWHEKLKVNVLPEGLVYSYRRGASLKDDKKFEFRKDYVICLFHQYPKQTDLLDNDFVKEYW